MCSVAGAENQADVEDMLEIMKHRSPDGVGVFFDGKYSIGMGRLKIVGGDYELPFRKGKHVLSFNGEIYNYKDIQMVLRDKGHVFTTNSDTEVVLEAYLEWGEKCLDKFNGMFAFAIYD